MSPAPAHPPLPGCALWQSNGFAALAPAPPGIPPELSTTLGSSSRMNVLTWLASGTPSCPAPPGEPKTPPAPPLKSRLGDITPSAASPPALGLPPPPPPTPPIVKTGLAAPRPLIVPAIVQVPRDLTSNV